MKSQILTPARSGQCSARCEFGIRSQNRPLFVDNSYSRIIGLNFAKELCHDPTIRTLIVKKFNDCYIRAGGANRWVGSIAEQRVAYIADGFWFLFREAGFEADK